MTWCDFGDAADFGDAGVLIGGGDWLVGTGLGFGWAELSLVGLILCPNCEVILLYTLPGGCFCRALFLILLYTPTSLLISSNLKLNLNSSPSVFPPQNVYPVKA
jgi:hypothetical protein